MFYVQNFRNDACSEGQSINYVDRQEEEGNQMPTFVEWGGGH